MKDGLRKLLEELTVGLSKHYAAGSEFVLWEDSADGPQSIVSKGPGGGPAWRANEAEQLGFCLEHGHEEEGGRFGRLLQTTDGRVLKVSAVRIGAPDDTASWTLSVCTDITQLWMARGLLDQTLLNGADDEDDEDELRDIDNILYNMIQDSIAHVGASPARMTREQKIKGVGYLNQRGAFRIMNSGPLVAKFYNISKYTVYNYINERDRTTVATACELD